jgi:signal peptidase I
VFRNLRESVGLSTPKSEFIKRVVGIGGDTVEIRDGELLVNGEPVDEPYLHPRTDMPDFGPESVPEGSIFVMGDNRNASQDSRVFGSVSEDAVVGEAFVIIWPIDRWGGL